MSIPARADVVDRPGRLLEMFLGSEAAAEQERHAIARRKRGDALRCRLAARSRGDEEPAGVRRELERAFDGFRDELAEALAALHGGDK